MARGSVVVVDISQLVAWNRLLSFEAVAIAARVEPAVGTTAGRVEGAAQRDAPVDTGLLTSRIGTTGRGLRRRVRVGPGMPRPYHMFQEFGTKRHPAQPFLLHQANQQTHDEFFRRVDAALMAGAVMRGGLSR